MVEDMAFDLTKLQEASAALEKTDMTVAADIMDLTYLVDRLLKKAADSGTTAAQAAVHSIAVHVNAVVTRLAADVAAYQPSTSPGASPAPNPTPVVVEPVAPAQPPTDPTAEPNPAPGAGGVVPEGPVDVPSGTVVPVVSPDVPDQSIARGPAPVDPSAPAA